MKKNSRRLPTILAVVTAGALTLIAAVTEAPVRHERKEVAGLAVVFGAEPEPAVTGEMQSLVWRVSSLEDKEPYKELRNARVVIRFNGEEYGPYVVRGSRRDPGFYSTKHIFTADGEYESVLSFRKGDDEEVHTVDFSFRIGDRRDLELPPRKRGGN